MLELRHDFQNGGLLDSAILDFLPFSKPLKTTKIRGKKLKPIINKEWSKNVKCSRIKLTIVHLNPI